MEPSEKKYEPVKSVIAEETFCCGFKRCPSAKVYEDGSMDLDDDGQHIEFTSDQAKALKALLNCKI